MPCEDDPADTRNAQIAFVRERFGERVKFDPKRLFASNGLGQGSKEFKSWSPSRSFAMVFISQAMSAHALQIIQGLTLISAANGAPVLVAWALRARPARPIDGGIVLRDGHPLLGRSKTWRGIASAIVLATFVSVLIGLPWRLGVLAAASAMAGDGLSSFFKRRFGLEPSSMTLGLDQIPESLFPALACAAYLPLSPIDVFVVVLIFSVGGLAASQIFFAIGVRDRPY